jgi:hypothetical protein
MPILRRESLKCKLFSLFLNTNGIIGKKDFLVIFLCLLFSIQLLTTSFAYQFLQVWKTFAAHTFLFADTLKTQHPINLAACCSLCLYIQKSRCVVIKILGMNYVYLFRLSYINYKTALDEINFSRSSTYSNWHKT